MADAGRELVRRLRRRLGRDAVRDDPAALAVYARDASHLALGRPLCVCLPRDAAGVAAALAVCHAAGAPVVCRGAGTGLSGGAVPPDGAVVLSLRRLEALAVDPARREARAGAGVFNGALDRRAARHGLTFAPDPGSRSASTVGGNVAENAGGPHAARDGVTLHHVRELWWCDAAGRRHRSGDRLAPWPALDLAALLVGSEGRLGVVTEARLQLVPRPREAVTLLAYFASLPAAARAVTALRRAGLEPVALELVDAAMLTVVEEAFHFGLRTDAAAALLVELAGTAAAVADQGERAAAVLREAGADSVDAAREPARREELWRCRRRAFGGVGRLAPDYVTMDVVVPPGRLPELVAAVEAAAARHRVRIATVGHAADGNLHPGVMYDPDVPGEGDRAHAAGDAVMAAALALDGSVTGEHGVGLEKLHVVAAQLDREALRLMHSVCRAWDPAGLLNPGKALPPVDGAPPPPSPPPAVRWDWDSLAVTAPATTPVRELQAAALTRGLWLPVGVVPDGVTVGELAAAGLAGPPLLAPWRLRDLLLEVWAETGDGRSFHAGRPVLKNVAGLDLVRLVTGEGGMLATLQAVTARLVPCPGVVATARAADPDGTVRRRWAGVLAREGDRHLAPAVLAAGESVVAAWLEPPARDRGAELEECLRAAAGGPVTLDRLSLPEAWDSVTALLPPRPDWWTAAPDPADPAAVAAVAADADLLTAPWPLLAWRAAPPPGAAAAGPRSADAGTAAWRPVRSGGRPVPPPPPPPGVPRDLAARLKRLFDPDLRLPTPDWLREALP